MDDQQKHKKPRIGAETRDTSLPYARESNATSKRSSPRAHNGNNATRVRFASLAGSIMVPEEKTSEHQIRYLKDEELGNNFEEDCSDDDQTSIHDAHFFNRGRPKQISRQTPSPAQNEIAKLIQQRAIRRLVPTSTCPNHPELDRPPITSVLQRYLIQHEPVGTQQAMTYFFSLYGIDIQTRDREKQTRFRLFLRGVMIRYLRGK